MASNVPKKRLNDGSDIPVLGLGTYKSADIADVISIAIDCGYRHFDCADVYQNEPQIGKALKEAIDSGKAKREELYIVTKVWPNWFGKGRPTASAIRSLKNLQMDYLDLLLIHWPTPFKQQDEEFWPLDASGQVLMDTTIDIVDVWKEFQEIKKSGLTHSIGVSNFNSQQLEAIISGSETVPAVNQVESHPYLSNDQLIQWCNQRGIAVTAYSPLARIGYNINVSPLELPIIQELAAKYVVSPAAVCLRWQTQRGVVVIPKSATEDRIRQNINIFHFCLTEEEVKTILALNQNLRTAKHNRNGTDKHPNWPFGQQF